MYVYENDAKKDKKSALRRIGIGSVRIAVRRSWYDGTGSRFKNIW